MLALSCAIFVFSLISAIYSGLTLAICCGRKAHVGLEIINYKFSHLFLINNNKYGNKMPATSQLRETYILQNNQNRPFYL